MNCKLSGLIISGRPVVLPTEELYDNIFLKFKKKLKGGLPRSCVPCTPASRGGVRTPLLSLPQPLTTRWCLNPGGGGYLPQVWVPTMNRTPKAVAVKAETEERWPPHTLEFRSGGKSLKEHALTLWPLKQDMKSLLQAKYRQTLIIKCFRYNLYITGSHFGERFTNIAKWGAVIDRWQIRSGSNPKIGGR